MTTRAMGPLAGIGWLKNAINLGRHNPKAIFGGAGLILLVALLPSAITLPAQLLLKPGPTGLIAIMAFSMLASLLLVPLVGGYLQLIDAVEHRRPARATDVFAPYRNGGGALRLIGFGVAMLAVYLVVVAAIIAVAGTGIFTWYLQVLAASPETGANAAAMPQLPAGLGLAIALGSVFGLFLSGMYSIGFGQIALGRRSIGGALGDGFAGGLKNLLPLLVLVLAALVAWVAVVVAFLLLALLLGLLAKLLGAWFLVTLMVLMVPLYIGLLLSIYVVMFGVMYYLWRDVCGGNDATAPSSTEALTA